MSKFTEKLKRAFGAFKATSVQENRKVTGYETQGYSIDNSGKKKVFLKEMKSWVGGCVSAIADEVAMIDIKLYQMTNNGIEEVEEHPILNLLYRVNDFTTKFDHFWLTEAYLKLTGESPWLLERKGSTIENIYFLRPDRIVPIVGDDKLISGYRYRLDGAEEVILPLECVIFLKMPDPSNPFRGLGTLQMAALAVDIDNNSEKWNNRFYANSAHPDNVLSVNVDQLDEEQLDKLKKSIKEQYQGIKNAHKLMVLFGDMKLDTLGFSHKDMDFLEQQRFGRDKILGLFKVPKAILSQTEGVNFASAKVAQYVFSRYTIKPEMERLIQQLNEFLLPLFPGTEKMFLDYANPVPEDAESKSKIYESGLKNGYLTINEVRSKEGLSDVEGGDVIYLPLNIAPIGSSKEEGESKILKVMKKFKKPLVENLSERVRSMKSRNKKYFEVEKIEENIYKKVREAIKLQINQPVKKEIESPESNVSQLSGEEKLAFWKKKDAITDKFVPKVEKIMKNIFKAQGKRVANSFNKFKALKLDANMIYNGVKLNEVNEIKTTIELTLPILEETFKEAGDEAFAVVGSDELMDMEREDIQRLLNLKARNFAKTTTKYTNEQIKKTIVNGIAGGKSVNELEDAVKVFFHKSETFRAERIARSEVVRYNTLASETAYIESGIVSQKEWFVNPGACQFCIPLDGKTVDLGETYFEKGDIATGNEGGKLTLDYDTTLAPPLHPNCRCDLVPIFK